MALGGKLVTRFYVPQDDAGIGLPDFGSVYLNPASGA